MTATMTPNVWETAHKTDVCNLPAIVREALREAVESLASQGKIRVERGSLNLFGWELAEVKQ